MNEMLGSREVLEDTADRWWIFLITGIAWLVFALVVFQWDYTSVSAISYLATPQLWFESFQNWQSEFMSIGALVVLSIFLRQRGSPESKPVDAPHTQTGSE